MNIILDPLYSLDLVPRSKTSKDLNTSKRVRDLVPMKKPSSKLSRLKIYRSTKSYRNLKSFAKTKGFYQLVRGFLSDMLIDFGICTNI